MTAWWACSMLTVDTLVSYAFHHARDLGALRAAIGPEALLLVDSGAFTAHSSGKVITIDAYADYLQTWEGVYDGAITLDVIGDPKASWVNTKALWDRGLPVIPVQTIGGTLREFDELCEQSDWVALGGLVNVNSNALRSRYVRGLSERAAGNGVAMHVLGSQSAEILRSGAVFSSDSSVASRAITYGKITLFNEQRLFLRCVRAKDHGELADARAQLVRHGISTAAIAGVDALGSPALRDGRTVVPCCDRWGTCRVSTGHDERRTEMGACEFEVVAKGATVKEAFSRAVEYALHAYGHDGYSGTIAEKSSFAEFGKMPEGVKPCDLVYAINDYLAAGEQGLELVEVADVTRRLVGHFGEQKFGQMSDLYDDKREAALCVQVSDGAWLFCGTASS